MMRSVVPMGLASVALAACTQCGSADAARDGASSGAGAPRATLTITSEALRADQPIPAEYACTDHDRLGTSPPLGWSAPPEGTKSIAVTVVDPDAKRFVHWAVVGIPPTTTSLPAGASPGGALPAGAVDLPNDFGKPGYGGPCPPAGAPHHYVFRVYALREPVEAKKPDVAFFRKLDEAALAAGSVTVTHKR